MTCLTTSRRQLLLAALALPGLGLGPRAALAAQIHDLSWDDLLPEDAPALPPSLQGVVPHDEGAAPAGQAMSTGVRTDWNGEIVRLAGFIIPLDYSGTGVTAFILVPYVGACIHVPPPPPNQLVLVTTETPYEDDGLFAPVVVTGMFGTAQTSTQLADIGYALSADKVEPYS
ncbi:DUF3299 domain-containing protein [Marinibacterium sp. SX1]|uniref:DUF3299 domain-containing protein n=1 Tax=Marinibacterium sp. SX1 TaxID=3388424 RepID=UPI003D16B1B7